MVNQVSPSDDCNAGRHLEINESDEEVVEVREKLGESSYALKDDCNAI